MMANKIKISKGDIGEFYEPSDSDEEYTEREKKLLNKVRKGKQKNEDSEDEVMAFDDADDDDDFGDHQENSDFEEDDRTNGIPDERAWGKKRKDFYSTDFVDQDYSSYNVNEEYLAEQEESEARAIQQRLAKQLEESDFSLDVYGSSTKSDVEAAEIEQTKIHLKTDLSDLSHREKVQMFRKDSPEFDGLVQDFESRLQESQTILEPILEYFSDRNQTTLPIIDFVTTKNNLILTYCSNVAFYLVLKAKRVPIKNHPLVKRLVQMRQLLLQLEEKYERLVKPQLKKLLEDIASGQELIFTSDTTNRTKKQPKQTKKLQFLKNMEAAAADDDEMDDSSDDNKDDSLINNTKTKQSDSEEDEPEEEQEEFGEDDERRQITYQMSKNKGLTPHRKKELRNPRVKHRNKFRKAIIRRKGAVRTVRKEDKRYGGEVSGIKASTKKGIKIK